MRLQLVRKYVSSFSSKETQISKAGLEILLFPSSACRGGHTSFSHRQSDSKHQIHFITFSQDAH